MSLLSRGVLLVALAAAPLAAQPDPMPIVRRASSIYRGLSSLQADFVQVIEDTRLGDSLPSTGTMYQQGQNLFAMRFTDPPEEAIVIDGKYSWFYTPSTAPNQVIRMPMESDPVYGVNLLARILDRPADRYETTFVRNDTLGGRRVQIVAITPRGTNVNFSRAVVWIDAEDALPRRVELDEGPGIRRILTLSRLRPNTPIPKEQFEFRVPKGVRIVDNAN